MTTAIPSQQALLIAALLDYHETHTLDAAELQLAVRYVLLADEFGICNATIDVLLDGLVARKRGRRAGRRAFAGGTDVPSTYAARKRLEYTHRIIRCSRAMTNRTHPRTGCRMFTPWRVELLLDTSKTIRFAYGLAAEWLAALFADETLTSTERYVALQLVRKLDYSGRLDTTRKALARTELIKDGITHVEEGITHVERKTALAALDHLQARGLLSWSDDKTRRPRVLTIRATVPSAADIAYEDDSDDYTAAAIVTGADDNEAEDDGFIDACAAEVAQQRMGAMRGGTKTAFKRAPSSQFSPTDTCEQASRVITDAHLDYSRPDGQVVLTAVLPVATPAEKEGGRPAVPVVDEPEPETKPARLTITQRQLDSPRFEDELRAMCVRHPGPHKVELMLLGGGTPFGLLSRADQQPVRIAWPDAAFRAAVSALRDVAPPLPAEAVSARAVEPMSAPVTAHAVRIVVSPEQLDDPGSLRSLRAAVASSPGPRAVFLSIRGRSAFGEETSGPELPLMASADGSEQMRASATDELKEAIARWRREWEQEQRQRQLRTRAQRERSIEDDEEEAVA